MAKRWTEVTDLRELSSCRKDLSKVIKASTKAAGKRRIGWPKGSFLETVRAATNADGDEYWVYFGNDSTTGDFITLIGRMPANAHWHLLIDLQFNFPAQRFSRMKGGAFVKDETGRLYLAHRAIVTRGTSRVPKEMLFSTVRNLPVISVAGTRTRGDGRLFLVGALDDEDLFEKMCDAAVKVRVAAQEIMSDEDAPPVAGVNSARRGETRKQDVSDKSRDPLDIVLSEYRSEFCGTTTHKARGKVAVSRNHGKVVAALAAELQSRGNLSNPYNMDLVCHRGKQFDLYEVKTSSSSQAVFTAIGQLVFLGAALRRKYNQDVRRHLVLPVSLDQEARQKFCKELGLEVVTYERVGKGRYRFYGLS